MIKVDDSFIIGHKQKVRIRPLYRYRGWLGRFYKSMNCTNFGTIVLYRNFLVCLIHNTQHTITMVIGGSNGRSDPMGDTEILIMLSIGHGLTIIQQRPSTNEHCNPSLLATIYCL